MKNIEALRATPGIRIGAQAVGHSIYFVGRLFAYLIGIKDPKFVVGYSGTELDLAVTRGEADGRINNADTMLSRSADLLAKEALDLHVIMEVPKGLKQPGFDGLPEIEEFAKSDKERKLLAMIRTFRQVGTPSILPPGTPPEQVKSCATPWRRCTAIRNFPRTTESWSAKSRRRSRRRDGERYQRIAARSRDAWICSKSSTPPMRYRQEIGFSSFKKFKPFKSFKRRDGAQERNRRPIF